MVNDTTSHPQDEFDSPWKEAIETYFEEFIAFFLPAAYTEIDWQRPPEFLDTELQQIVRDAELGRRLADRLVKVWLKDGQEQWVLIHVEVQGQHEVVFELRMYVYNYRIFDRYGRTVVSLAILSDERDDWKPGRFTFERWGCQLKFDFPIVKLLEYKDKWTELEASNNPFATMVMAHLKTQETRHDSEQRQFWKFKLTRRLYERGYSRQNILNLFHFIDWMMKLPEDLEDAFTEQLYQFEEERHMPYITTIERRGIERGIEQGALRQLLRLLRNRFGEVPEEVAKELFTLGIESLEQLLDAALTAESIDGFVASVLEVSDTSLKNTEDSNM